MTVAVEPVVTAVSTEDSHPVIRQMVHATCTEVLSVIESAALPSVPSATLESSVPRMLVLWVLLATVVHVPAVVLSHVTVVAEPPPDVNAMKRKSPALIVAGSVTVWLVAVAEDAPVVLV